MFIPLINTRNPFHFLPHLQIRLQVSYPRTLQIANLFILTPSQANSLKDPGGQPSDLSCTSNSIGIPPPLTPLQNRSLINSIHLSLPCY